MRDARKIKERNEANGSSRIGIVAVLGVATALVSYNVGLQVGLSRGDTEETEKGETSQPLAAIDTAQKKHDAMQFYTRLTQQEKAVKPAQQEQLQHDAIEAEPVIEKPAEVTKVETARDAVARMVVTPAKPEPQATPEPEPQTVASGEFTVQVSAFQTSEEAEAYKSSLTRKGYNPYVIPAEIAGKGIWYRVRVGRYETKTRANEAKAQLALVNIPSFVVETH